MSRTEAEYYLKRSTKDGSFLVRHGQDRDSFVISFRCVVSTPALAHVVMRRACVSGISYSMGEML